MTIAPAHHPNETDLSQPSCCIDPLVKYEIPSDVAIIGQIKIELYAPDKGPIKP